MSNTKGKRMYYKISKFLTIGLLSCSVQFMDSLSASNVSEENNNQIIDEQNTHNNIFNEFQDNTKSSKSNILTLSNNNFKCWFMSTFQLFVTALNQSELNDPIRRTNFARFVNHLHNMQIDFSRRINTQPNEIDSYKRKVHSEWNYFEKNSKYKFKNVTRDKTGKINVIGERIDLISELINWFKDIEKLLKNNQQEKNKLLNEKNKLNSNQEEINKKLEMLDNDLKMLINQKNIIYKLDRINNITKGEKERREKTLELLYQLQDMNAPSSSNIAVMIILNIFPELQKFFGSKIIPTENGNVDEMINAANEFILDNNTMKKEVVDMKTKSIATLDKRIKDDLNDCWSNYNRGNYETAQIYYDNANINKKDKIRKQNEIYNIQNNNNNDYMNIKLSSFSDYNGYFSESNQNTSKIPYIKSSNEKDNYSNKPYLILKSSGLELNTVITNYKYINVNNNAKNLTTYELIGIQLDNNEHGICFVKTGKSDSSWSSIDSNRNANDDGYTLDDIIYKLGNENTYLAKVYDDRVEKRTTKKFHDKLRGFTERYLQQTVGYFKYKPKLLLYKRVLQNDISGEIN